jgi:tetratricopeptide (TPR) repeat protein
MDAGRNDEAVAALERSLELFPRPNVYLQLARAQELRERLDLALRAYDAADELRPGHGETLRLRGIAHLRQGDAVRASADLARAFALEPTSEAKLYLGLAALRREAWSEAESHFRTALELDPDARGAHAGLGRALFQEQRFAEALGELVLALAAAPGDADLSTLAGASLCALERPAEALEHFQRALAIPPDSAEEHFNLGRALGDLRRHDEAAREARKALELAPEMAQAHDLLARSLLGKPEATVAERADALAAALEAARLTQSSRPRILETLATAYAASGDRARARATIEQALASTAPDNVELRARLAARRDEYGGEAPR